MLISAILTSTIMKQVEKTLAYNTIYNRVRGEKVLGCSTAAVRCPIIKRHGTQFQIRMTIMATRIGTQDNA